MSFLSDLQIQPTTAADLAELLSLWNDGQVMGWVGFPNGLGYDQPRMQAWFARLQQAPQRHHFCVRQREAGFCGELYYACDNTNRASLDLKLRPHVQRRGLGRLALSWLIEHVFVSEPGVELVYTEPAAANLAARALYARCGLQPRPRPADLHPAESFWALTRMEWLQYQAAQQGQPASPELRLLLPAAEWATPFCEMARDYAAEGFLRYLPAIDDFNAYLELLWRRETAPAAGLMPETTFWAVQASTLVGVTRLRHGLNPALEQIGGHIGYDIRPSMRGRGHGTRLLSLTLAQARARGLPRVLITCDTVNRASARVIEKNGGVLFDQQRFEAHPQQVSRYWIELGPHATIRL